MGREWRKHGGCGQKLLSRPTSSPGSGREEARCILDTCTCLSSHCTCPCPAHVPGPGGFSPATPRVGKAEGSGCSPITAQGRDDPCPLPAAEKAGAPKSLPVFLSQVTLCISHLGLFWGDLSCHFFPNFFCHFAIALPATALSIEAPQALFD